MTMSNEFSNFPVLTPELEEQVTERIIEIAKNAIDERDALREEVKILKQQNEALNQRNSKLEDVAEAAGDYVQAFSELDEFTIALIRAVKDFQSLQSLEG